MISPNQFSIDEMLADLGTLVTMESPSRDIERVTAHAHALSEMMVRHLGSAPTLIDSPVGPHVHWKGGGEPKVLILGHHDTVHPVGTLADIPFSTDNGIARGPGVFDMKAGIVQALLAIASLPDS